MAIAAKRLKRGLAFSAEGQREIRDMLERLAGNVQTAAAVFMTDDVRAARTSARRKFSAISKRARQRLTSRASAPAG